MKRIFYNNEDKILLDYEAIIAMANELNLKDEEMRKLTDLNRIKHYIMFNGLIHIN